MNQNTIKSFQRGLRMLEILSAAFKPLTLTEIARQMKINLPAAQRFLNTLCETGYVHRDSNKCYVLSSKVLLFGLNLLSESTLARIAMPILDSIHAQLSETVNINVMDGFEIVQLYRREGPSVIKYNLGPGSRLPAHCTSTGKMLLAGMPDDQIIERMRTVELSAITPRTITSKNEFMREIKKIRERGYSISDRELSMDLYSVAVPVLNEQRKTVAAVNVTTSFLGTHKKKDKILKTLMNAGKNISSLLGYQGEYPPVSCDC